MATTKEMLDDAELAKSYITNSNLSDDYKRTYLRLLNLATMATNGISPEEKIQKMTEAIQLLAVTQGMFMAGIDDRIDKAVDKANKKQCSSCKAMKHATVIEEKEKNDAIINAWKEANGFKDGDDDSNNEDKSKSWMDVVKTILMKPYIYIFFTLAIISPYGVQILDKILAFYSK